MKQFHFYSLVPQMRNDALFDFHLCVFTLFWLHTGNFYCVSGLKGTLLAFVATALDLKLLSKEHDVDKVLHMIIKTEN